MKSVKLVVVGTLVASVAMGSGVALAESKFVKAAKDMGLPAKDCQYCHTEKLPKKESFKPDALNERGKWLFAEKATRKADKADPAWLSDYKGPKE